MAMLGLTHQIARDDGRIRRIVRDDPDLGRPGEHIDPDFSKQDPFRLRHVLVARPDDDVRRLAHGVRIVDDIAVDDDGNATLGRLAAYVRDMRIPLEMCPTSNIDTGAAKSIAEHPIGLLAKLRFRVTLNTDNRLMSGVSMTSEMAALVETFGYDWADLQWFTVNAMKSAFLRFDERLALINDVIKPGYAALQA